MSSLNKVLLIGRLGKDPELRYTPDGTPVASFSLATSENWTDKNGTRQEVTEWHNIVAGAGWRISASVIWQKGRQGVHRRADQKPGLDRQGRQQAPDD